MNTMLQRLFATTILGLALPVQSATLTIATSAPTPGTNDIYNFAGAARDGANVSDGSAYADGAANDAFTYVAGDRADQGQTFITGSNTNGYTITAVWLRHVGYTNNTALTWWQMNSGVSMTVRVTDPTFAGTSGFALDTETYTTTGSEGWSGGYNSTNGSGSWLQFTFSSPITLSPNKTYGFDVASSSTSAFFEWLGTSNNVYPGGGAYNGSTSGTPDNTMNTLAGDRVFLVALAVGTNAPTGGTNSPAGLVSFVAVPFDLTNVTLLPSPFQTNMLLDEAYLLSLDSDRLLYSFRANAGLSTSNAVAYGGWETPGDTLCLGHFVGHYLSACSQMYASTGDSRFKARTDFLVGELGKCQAASPAAGFNAGYLAAFPESYINDLINETQNSYFSVPWYTLHKGMAGLLDVYQHTGNNQALTVLTNMANWVQFRLYQLTSSQIQAMLNYREYGGMNEVLANLYAVTGNTNYLRIAADFDKQSLFTPLSQDQDVLDGLHANTQIPEITGAAREYELTGANSYHEIASFFWNRVADYRSYVIGGDSESEYFFPITDFPSHLTPETCETCNTYNMLKLTRHLFEWSPSAATMDFYERALYNQILGSETAPGSMTYFVSLEPGSFKTYSTTDNSFWCCDGTGVENHSKYGDTIYFHGTNSLYLNLFIPSQLNWPDKGLTVVQNTAFPQSDTTTLTFQCTNGLPLTLNIRYPSWAQSGILVSINGVSQTITNSPGSYVSVTRNWQTNDQVQIQLPMTLRTEVLQDTASTVALFYGPILLAGTLGTNGMPASDIAAGQGDLTGVSIPAGTVPLLVADIPTLLTNTVPVPGQPLTFQTEGVGRPNDVTLIPFYQLQHQRYSVYWSLMGPSAVCVWSGGGSPANWSVGANWNLTPTNQCAVQFGLASGGTTANDLTAGTQINGIQFITGAGGFVLNGNSIVLQGDVVNNSSSTQQINLPIQLNGGGAWNFNAAAGDLTLGNTVSGSGVLNKQGAHTLTVLSNLTFSGSAHVAAGQLQIGNGGASGSLGSLTVAVDAGASLAFNRGDTFQIGNAISGAGSVIKRGAGTMQLSGVLSNTGPTIVEAGTLQIVSQPVSVLKHRWSFNGNLTDSAGASNAVVVDVGANNTTLTSSSITLAGGSQSASDYVTLGSGLLPKDGSPVTIELWASQISAQNWSRIFDVGSSTADYLFMSWSQGTTTTQDRVEWQDATKTTMDNTCAPYTLGTEYHIAMVVQPGAGSGGTTRATWYAGPTNNSSLGTARGTFDTANALANLNDVNFWLGRSEYGGDSTANASYDEVRLWNRAFSQAELQQLHALGPNAVGAFATNNVTGALDAQSDLTLLSGATLDIGGTAQQVASVTGASGSVIQLNGGQLNIAAGGNTAATFAGSFAGTGSVQINGTLRLVGNASIASGIILTNNGTLDIMTWSGTLPAGFVNHGTVLDRSRIKINTANVGTNGFNLTIQGYLGHTYQLQSRDNLATGGWQNSGAPLAGDDALITFTDSSGITGSNRFYRVAIGP
jgi:hypothetical protein